MKTWRGRSTSSFCLLAGVLFLPPAAATASEGRSHQEANRKRTAGNRPKKRTQFLRHWARSTGTWKKKTKDLNAASSKIAPSGLK